MNGAQLEHRAERAAKTATSRDHAMKVKRRRRRPAHR